MSSISTPLAALVLTGALAVAGVAVAQPTVVNIQLSEYKFAPAQLTLEHGQAYVLHLTNTGGKAHDLSAKAFFQTVALAPGSAGKVKDGDVDLDDGESADVALTPQKPGTYEMHCTHPFHSMLGMKGQIVVR
ncbi:MAG TPA: cupredoxin domain-containing protein [Caulobacteraceae bacterium]|jgi:uncharacterized cupredoxin-like copper-binding protein|nr:cupredoxin domain-containing protein [Caulobacteraceae bacterium]